MGFFMNRWTEAYTLTAPLRLCARYQSARQCKDDALDVARPPPDRPNLNCGVWDKLWVEGNSRTPWCAHPLFSWVCAPPSQNPKP